MLLPQGGGGPGRRRRRLSRAGRNGRVAHNQEHHGRTRSPGPRWCTLRDLHELHLSLLGNGPRQISIGILNMFHATCEFESRALHSLYSPVYELVGPG